MWIPIRSGIPATARVIGPGRSPPPILGCRLGRKAVLPLIWAKRTSHSVFPLTAKAWTIARSTVGRAEGLKTQALDRGLFPVGLPEERQ